MNVQRHALWKLPSTRHATSASNKLLGRFSTDVPATKFSVALAVYDWLDLRIRYIDAKPSWNSRDVETVENILESFSKH